MRWFAPPPQRTAYFSSARSPGVVLRVSRTTQPVPSSASAHRRVSVATPDRWHSRLSAVRSAVSSDRVGAVTRATSSPGADPVAVGDEVLDVGGGVAAHGVDRRGGDGEPGHDTVTAAGRTSRRCAGRRARWRPT